MSLFKPESIAKLSESKRHYLEQAFPLFVQLENSLLRTDFYAIPKEHRFDRVQQFFSVMTEIRDYDLIESSMNNFKKARYDDVRELFQFCRNIFAHFAYYKSWDEVWITRRMAKETFKGTNTGKIEKFLCTSRELLKFKVSTEIPNEEFFIDIHFPVNPEYDQKIYLKDIIDEFSAVLLASVTTKFALYGHLSSNRYRITIY